MDRVGRTIRLPLSGPLALVVRLVAHRIENWNRARMRNAVDREQFGRSSGMDEFGFPSLWLHLVHEGNRPKQNQLATFDKHPSSAKPHASEPFRATRREYAHGLFPVHANDTRIRVRALRGEQGPGHGPTRPRPTGCSLHGFHARCGLPHSDHRHQLSVHAGRWPAVQ